MNASHLLLSARSQDGKFIPFSSFLQIHNNPRPSRQNRGRMNGHVLPQGGGPTYPSHLQQPSQSIILSKDSSKRQVYSHFYFDLYSVYLQSFYH